MNFQTKYWLLVCVPLFYNVQIAQPENQDGDCVSIHPREPIQEGVANSMTSSVCADWPGFSTGLFVFCIRDFLLATVCFTLVINARGQAGAGAVDAAAGAVAGADGGSPVVALILQFARGARDALRLFQRLMKALSRYYEAVSPEFEGMRCIRKAVFTRVIPPYLKPPWPAEGWTYLTRRKRNINPHPQRPFLIINDPLAPASPPQLRDKLEYFLLDLFGNPSILEAWRDFKSSWFGVVSARSSKCMRDYVSKRFWGWVKSAP